MLSGWRGDTVGDIRAMTLRIERETKMLLSLESWAAGAATC